MCADAIVMVVYVSTRQEGLSSRQRPSCHVAITNTSVEMVIIHIMATNKFQIVAAVHVRVD